MFKKIISAMLVLVIMATAVASASALCSSENGRPEIVGLEHLESVKKLDSLWREGEVEIPYTIKMSQCEGYWVVIMESEDYDEICYEAIGMYDHYPTGEEIDILWANRMTEDEMDEFKEALGF